MLLKAADNLTKKCPKIVSSPGIRTRGLPGSKKVIIFCLKLYHWATKTFYKLWAKYSGKLVNSNLCLIDMEHDFNLTLKMYKSAFSDKQIIEIKKKMHIDPIFTYSDSEIALKVCRNKQRIKFNRRPLCSFKIHWTCFVSCI